MYADIARLRYTRMVFEETLRLYPPAYSMGRTAVAPDVIGGVTVPKGAIISIYPYVTHRNPALWPDPECFDPERFAPTVRSSGTGSLTSRSAAARGSASDKASPWRKRRS